MKNLTSYSLFILFVFTSCAANKDIHLYDGPRLEKDQIKI